MTGIRVLQSFPAPRETTNPYLHMLLAAEQGTAGLEVSTFTWRRALTDRYDVLHVHWPEVLLHATTRPRRLARALVVAVLVLRLVLRRTVVVRTQHNLGAHEAQPWTRRALLAALDSRTRAVVRLNERTPVRDGAAAVTIPHGHYRPWFAGVEQAPRRPGTLAFVGLVRPYKNVEALLDVFAATRSELPGARLVVAGRVSDAALEAAVRERAAGDDRVVLDLRHLTDPELAGVVTAAELVVLPYREMHNSGVVLMALSLGRPVLVPDNEVSRALAAEVGPGWVHTYTGELTPAVLTRSLAAAATATGSPRLDDRGWEGVGTAHLSAYRAALARR